MSNICKLVKIYIKILVMGLVCAVGILIAFCANSFQAASEIFFAIGSGAFSSALCMFIYEIINTNKARKRVLIELKNFCTYSLMTNI